MLLLDVREVRVIPLHSLFRTAGSAVFSFVNKSLLSPRRISKTSFHGKKFVIAFAST